MSERIKTSWHLFATSRAGLRFTERYRLRQSRRRGRFDLSRVLYVVGGVALLVTSTLFGWLPVLGWGTVVIGLGMIAGEYYPLARLMDRQEVRTRRLFGPLAKILRRLPAWAQLVASLTIAAFTFTLVYGFYSLGSGG